MEDRRLREQVGPVRHDWWCEHRHCKHYKVLHRPWFRFDARCQHPVTLADEKCRDTDGHPITRMEMCPVLVRGSFLLPCTNYLGDKGAC